MSGRTCRLSFDNPLWVNPLGNVQMQKAIVMAQFALYAVVLVPGSSDMILAGEALQSASEAGFSPW